jgi:dephospho-CoA kinase
MHLRIGITGNIGSGKSTFSEFVSELGYPVLYADDISKEILSKDADVKSEVINHIGAKSYSGEKINNSFIANIVFSDQKKLKKLNSILHPKVRLKIDSLSKTLFKKNNIVFVEAALIYESKFENMFDYIVLITASYDIRMQRSIKNKHISKSDFVNRDSNQIKQDLKQNKADFTFSNDGTKNELKMKAVLLIKILESKVR